MIQTTNRINRNWCKSEDEKLRLLLKEGQSYAKISVVLKRKGTSVQQRASRLKIATGNTVQRWSTDDKQTLINMLTDGKKFSAILIALNRSEKSIRRFCSRNNLSIIDNLSIRNTKNADLKIVPKKVSQEEHKCLRCHEYFIHSGKGNHICKKCKSSKTEEASGLPEYYVGRVI